MKHISVIGKFFILMACFGVFTLAVALYSGRQIMTIDASYSALLDRQSAAALAIARANRSLQSARAAIGDLLMARTDAGNDAAEKEILASKAGFSQFMDTAISAMPDRADIVQMKADGLAILTNTCAGIIAAGKTATTDQDVNASQQMELQECQPAFVAISPKMVKLTDSIVNIAQAESDRLSDVSDMTAKLTVGGVVIGLALVLIGSYFAMRAWIVLPLKNTALTMASLAGGNLETVVEGTERRDEVGGMARAVQVFKDNGLRTRQLETDAELNRIAGETARERTVELERKRAEEMTQAASGLAEGLQHLASGDLTFRLNTQFAADFEPLRSNFNGAASKLADGLRAVADATSSIDSGAREISHGAEDLSKRTEQQAASLEETAAALDQITANVSNSSKRTEEARAVAVEANRSANQSGAVVSNAVAAMQKIEQSSHQISNIIGVIDEIAFQTNLLALNAGVEAARAGEAGKGFAVVAQEVRELAQRSAQAAKEIKELIRNSGEEVGNGVRLVQETGAALKIIEDQVITINTQLDAIASSAKEQSIGLAEVNTAVNQMDQVTQQNAAMVEQSTAASAALAGEVKRLREIVSGFRVGGEEATPINRPHLVKVDGKPVASPARRILAQVASAVGAAPKGGAASWEEF